jgi:hypothetical protein
MKPTALGLASLLLLTGCGMDTTDNACVSLQSSLARVEGVLFKSNQLIEAKGFSAFTTQEREQRANAGSERTDLWIRMDEIGCPHE